MLLHPTGKAGTPAEPLKASQAVQVYFSWTVEPSEMCRGHTARLGTVKQRASGGRDDTAHAEHQGWRQTLRNTQLALYWMWEVKRQEKSA